MPRAKGSSVPEQLTELRARAERAEARAHELTLEVLRLARVALSVARTVRLRPGADGHYVPGGVPAHTSLSNARHTDGEGSVGGDQPMPGASPLPEVVDRTIRRLAGADVKLRASLTALAREKLGEGLEEKAVAALLWEGDDVGDEEE